VAARKAKLREELTRVVKMRLSTWCTSSVLSDEFDTAAHVVTRVTVEASRFANYYVLRTLDAGEQLPKMDQTFFYRIFTTVAGAPSIFYAYYADYCALRDAAWHGGEADIMDTLHLPQVLNEACKTYLTAARNHVVLNLTRRVRKAFFVFLGSQDEVLRASDRHKLARYHVGLLSGTRSLDEEDDVWASLSRDVPAEFRETVTDYTRTQYHGHRALPLDTATCSRVEKRWWEYVPWLHELQIFLEDHEARQFSLLPIATFDVKYIRVTPTTLYGLLRRAHARNPRAVADPGPGPAFVANVTEHWPRYFRLRAVERGATTFAGSFLTDGYAVSVTTTRPKPQVAVFDVPYGGITDVDLFGKRVVSVDPGSRDLVTCLSYTEDGEQRSWRYSNAEYKEKIGAAKAGRRRLRWMQEDAALDVELQDVPSPKTGMLELFELHLNGFFAVLRRALRHCAMRRVRALRFTQYGRKQKVMHDICERILRGGGFHDDEREVVLAYGNATFTTRGRFPGPVKAVRKELRRRHASVHDVDEDYTSKLCSHCQLGLEPMFGENGRAIHAVRRCTTANCPRTTWHRDVNACLNILYVFLYEIQHGERPEVYTRGYQMQLNAQ